MNTRLLAPKLFYFCWFAALGSLMPFLSLYYREANLDLGQIGLLVSMTGIIQLVAAPVWGVLADTFRLQRMLLPIAAACTIPAVLLIGHTGSFPLLLVLLIIQSFFAAPVGALADSATLALLGDQRDRYGAQRVWGSVGWSVSTAAVGWLVGHTGYWVIFVCYSVLVGLAAASTLLLPKTQLARVNLAESARSLARDSRWLVFLGCVFLIGCCGSTVMSFLPIYLQDRGGTPQEIGLAFTIASLSELPVMAFSSLVLRRWGSQPLMITAGLLYALRVVLLIFAPSAGWALATQALHGLCYAALWTGGVVEAQRLAPSGFEATAQTLFGLASYGLASATASAIGGVVYQDYGANTLFSIGAAAAMVGAFGLMAQSVGQRRATLREPTHSHQ